MGQKEGNGISTRFCALGHTSRRLNIRKWFHHRRGNKEDEYSQFRLGERVVHTVLSAVHVSLSRKCTCRENM